MSYLVISMARIVGLSSIWMYGGIHAAKAAAVMLIWVAIIDLISFLPSSARN